MPIPSWLTIAPPVAAALANGTPVVALESTLIAHGLPFPTNIATARAAEAAIRDVGAVPATIAVLEGRPTIGLTEAQMEQLAHATNVLKASRRELGMAIAERHTAATTVAATMFLAHQAGLAIFATGGIGGAHPHGPPFDISADLFEFTRTPVLVVCAGAKSILDLPQTLELLETLGVPVWGYRTAEFPAFFTPSSGLPVVRVESATQAAMWFRTHAQLTGTGALLTQPVAAEVALDADAVAEALTTAEVEATAQHIRGAALTPYLLKRLAELTQQRTLRANQALIVANARLAAEVAIAADTKAV